MLIPRLFPHTVSFLLVSLLPAPHLGRPAAAQPTPASPAGLPTPQRAPAIEVPYDLGILTRYRGLIMLPVTIHGHVLHLILMYGVSETILTSTAMTDVGVTGDVVDSLTIGASVLHEVHVDTEPAGNVEMRAAEESRVPTGDRGDDVGRLGAQALSHYDFVFDGPARRVRLYAIPAEAQHSAWFPPGIIPANCTPMLPDPTGGHRVFFDLQANGTPLHSMFSSGYGNVVNTAADMALDSSKHLATLKGTKIPLALNGLNPSGIKLPAFAGVLPDSGPDTQELIMGLFAIQDRLFVVSYSTGQVCLGAPHPAVKKA